MITCPNCGAQNRDEEQICVKCGFVLVEINRQKTRTLGDTDYEEGMPRWGVARFDGTMSLVVTVLATGQEFVFDAESIERLTLGRTDPDTGQAPQINLEDSDARNQASRAIMLSSCAWKRRCTWWTTTALTGRTSMARSW